MNAHDPSCSDFEGLLPLHVGDDLDAAQARAVAGHLRACAHCAALAERARTARSVYRHGAVAGEPPALWGRIRQALVAEGLIRVPSSTWRAAPARRRWRPELAWGGLVSAAAALLLGVLWTVERPLPTSPDGAPAAESTVVEGGSAAPGAVPVSSTPDRSDVAGSLRRAGVGDARLADEVRWQTVPFVLLPRVGPGAVPQVHTASDGGPALR